MFNESIVYMITKEEIREIARANGHRIPRSVPDWLKMRGTLTLAIHADKVKAIVYALNSLNNKENQ